MPKDDNAALASRSDWFREPLSALLWWCVPILLGVAAEVLISSARVVAAVWAGAFVWMGVGCLSNASRCHRLHCYLSGPVFLVGAVVVNLLGFGAIDLGRHALENAVSVTLTLALLSFVPEWILGRYRTRR